MVCKNCGAMNPDDAKTCASCLKALPPPPVERTVVSAAPNEQLGASTMVRFPSPDVLSPPQTSGLAIAALVCGILGFFMLLLPSLVGLVLGIIALRQIGRSRGAITGSGMAIAGIALGGVGLMFVPILAAILLPVFFQAREKARQASCASNLKQMATATLMYTQDYDERMPRTANWSDAIYPYIKATEVFQCPDVGPVQAVSPQSSSRRSDYAYNSQMGSAKLEKIPSPADLAMQFDASGFTGWNAVGSASSIAYRHNDGANMAFADGHVQWRRPESLSFLIWDPYARALSGYLPQGMAQQAAPGGAGN